METKKHICLIKLWALIFKKKNECIWGTDNLKHDYFVRAFSGTNIYLYDPITTTHPCTQGYQMVCPSSNRALFTHSIITKCRYIWVKNTTSYMKYTVNSIWLPLACVHIPFLSSLVSLCTDYSKKQYITNTMVFDIPQIYITKGRVCVYNWTCFHCGMAYLYTPLCFRPVPILYLCIHFNIVFQQCFTYMWRKPFTIQRVWWVSALAMIHIYCKGLVPCRSRVNGVDYVCTVACDECGASQYKGWINTCFNNPRCHLTYWKNAIIAWPRSLATVLEIYIYTHMGYSTHGAETGIRAYETIKIYPCAKYANIGVCLRYI